MLSFKGRLSEVTDLSGECLKYAYSQDSFQP